MFKKWSLCLGIFSVITTMTVFAEIPHLKEKELPAITEEEQPLQIAFIADMGDYGIRPFINNVFTGDVGSCYVNTDGSIGICAYSNADNLYFPTDVIINQNVDPPVAYVANAGGYNSTNGYLAICDLKLSGDLFQVTNCQPFFDNSFGTPAGLQLTPDGKKLYVTNNNLAPLMAENIINADASEDLFSNSMVICNVNDDGSLQSPCEFDGYALTAPASVWVTSNDIAYLANANGNNISVCPLLNGQFVICADDPQAFNYPVDIIINEQYSKAYIANLDVSAISVCDVDLESGALSGCIAFYDDLFYFEEVGLQISPDNQWLYATNSYYGNYVVSACRLDSDGNLVSSCIVAADYTDGLNVPEGRVAFYKVGETYYVYIANYVDDNVLVCEYSSDDGKLSACEPSEETFNQPLSVAIGGNYLYVTDGFDTTIYICSLDPTNAEIIDCTESTEYFSFNDNNTNIFVTGSTVYIPNNASNSVAVCEASGETFADCTLWSSMAPVGRATFLTFDKQQYVYSVSQFGGILRCAIVDDEFTDCVNLAEEFLSDYDVNFYGVDYNDTHKALYITAFDNTTCSYEQAGICGSALFICYLHANGDITYCHEEDFSNIIDYDGFFYPGANLYARDNNGITYYPDQTGYVDYCDRHFNCGYTDFFYAPTSVWISNF